MTSNTDPAQMALGMIGIVPEAMAQYAPVALLALFPSAWLRRCCMLRQEAGA